MAEITEEQVATGVKSYRARCLDHGIEWRTTEPSLCPECTKDYATANPPPAPPAETKRTKDYATANPPPAPPAETKRTKDYATANPPPAPPAETKPDPKSKK